MSCLALYFLIQVRITDSRIKGLWIFSEILFQFVRIFFAFLERWQINLKKFRKRNKWIQNNLVKTLYFFYITLNFQSITSENSKNLKQCSDLMDWTFFTEIFGIFFSDCLIRVKIQSRGESAALGHFSVSIFFGQVDNRESKKNIVASQCNSSALL